MPWQKKSERKPKAERVVRHTLPDGTIKEYRYAAFKPKPAEQRRADTLADMIDAYKNSPEWRGLAPRTQVNYAIYLRPLEKAGKIDPNNLMRRDVLELRDSISATSGNAAANAFVTCARQIYNWGIDRERVETNPALKIKKLETGNLPAWSQEQADAALAGLPEHLRRVVVLAMFTGQRRGDLCKMTWADYDGQRIRVVQQKTDASLKIPVHPDLKAGLDAWKAETSVALTILADGHGKPWNPNNLSYHMPAALARLQPPEGVELPTDLNVHGLRKLAAANLAEAGCSTKEIAAITGHETLAMVELYTKSANQEHLATAAIHRLQTSDKYKKSLANG